MALLSIKNIQKLIKSRNPHHPSSSGEGHQEKNLEMPLPFVLKWDTSVEQYGRPPTVSQS